MFWGALRNMPLSEYDEIHYLNTVTEVLQPLQESRHSKSNPIELNFNRRTQSNSIRGLSSIEFGNRTKSNSHTKK